MKHNFNSRDNFDKTITNNSETNENTIHEKVMKTNGIDIPKNANIHDIETDTESDTENGIFSGIFFYDSDTEIDRDFIQDSDDSIRDDSFSLHESSDFNDTVETMIMAETPPDPFTTIQTRTRMRWVEDNHAKKCESCDSTFRMFLRIHHCVIEGTPVTLLNGMSRKIEDMKVNQSLPCWDKNNCNITLTKGYNDAVIDQAYESCYKIVLEDGRELITTSDHEILVTTSKNDTPKYIMMKNINNTHRVICSIIEGVLDDPSLDYESKYQIEGTQFNIRDDRDKCLAFARLCGFLGYSNNFPTNKRDILSLTHDLELISCNRFSIKKLIKKCRKDKHSLPFFLKNDNCPDSIKREFIAGYSSNNFNKSKYYKKYNLIGYRYNIEKETSLSLRTLSVKLNISRDKLNNHIKLTGNYYSLKVIDLPTLYKNGTPQHVYDLSVPNYVSFIANGIVVHNCRRCGGVFCSNCSNNWGTIPDCITHLPSSNGLKMNIDRKEKVRLCDVCDEKISLVKKLESLLKSAQSANMDIFEFKNISDSKSFSNKSLIVNSVDDNHVIWKQLANFYLSKFREIQYKLPFQEYTDWEKMALWTNMKYLKGHDVWVVHLIKAFCTDKIKLKEITNYCFTDNKQLIDGIMIKDKDACWQRMCTSKCQPELSWESSLLLLDVMNCSKVVVNEIIKSFDRCDDDRFEYILQYVIYNMVNSDLNETYVKYIISRCNRSVRIANCLYWSLVVNKTKKSDYLISQLFRGISSEIYEVIMEVNNFVKKIEENYVGDVNYNEPIQNLSQIKTCISPTNPEEGIKEVSSKILKGEKSATRPVPISLGVDNIILRKNEGLGTELGIMNIIHIMKNIAEKSLDMDLHVVTYNIQPTEKDCGYIRTVPKCKTLYYIEEKLKISLSNYIKKHNPDKSSKELTERFVRSTAFYSVVTFLLGIGDRHLDNIMLTENGELFHIDYGFVMGKDPKPMKTPHMRITDGMLDAIGGYHSEEYNNFKELCYEIYDTLRKHVNTFVCLLSLLPKQNTVGTWTNPPISENRILREIIKRFAPGENYIQAKSALHTKIDRSTSMTSISKYHVVDFFHRHNKEGTVRNILSYTVESTYSGTKTLFGGIWDYLSYRIT